jgi:hypothetical protein
VEGGGAGALGFRHTFSRADLDLSVAWTTEWATSLKAEVLSTPKANRTALYAGGGVSFSSVNNRSVTNEGLGAELTAGVSLSASHKWFVQADLSIPFFTLPDGYPAMFSMSLGYGIATR